MTNITYEINISNIYETMLFTQYVQVHHQQLDLQWKLQHSKHIVANVFPRVGNIRVVHNVIGLNPDVCLSIANESQPY